MESGLQTWQTHPLNFFLFYLHAISTVQYIPFTTPIGSATNTKIKNLILKIVPWKFKNLFFQYKTYVLIPFLILNLCLFLFNLIIHNSKSLYGIFFFSLFLTKLYFNYSYFSFLVVAGFQPNLAHRVRTG